MDDDILIKGFGFSGYRSFGNELTKVGPLKKINLIIGQNNSGKSNIIRFLKDQYTILHKIIISKKNNIRINKQLLPFQGLDKHQTSKVSKFQISFPLFETEQFELINQQFQNIPQNKRLRGTIEKIFNNNVLADENGIIWFTYYSNSPSGDYNLLIDAEKINSICDRNEIVNLCQFLNIRTNGDLIRDLIPSIVDKLAHIPNGIPEIEIIPAIRKIGASGSVANDFSGEGIIESLNTIQHPSLEKQSDKEKFLLINLFLKKVLENETAELEIPHEKNMILVHMDGKTLPLENLGTGVHEVVILAAAATLLEKTVLCIEEPELHLHPLLQKKLVQYLSENTNNQYFFTTHSAHLLDAVEAEIFHVTMEDGVSKVTAISSNKEKSQICNDLGYRASDLLQSNCIIWVEGPSDRVYINYWLKSVDDTLIEGVHYSIMFFGGRLFSHLTGLDEDELEDRIEDFISLRSLNRNSTIIFDSDKSSARKRLNGTKQRLKREFDLGPGFSWVTKGREIENYLEYSNLMAVIHHQLTMHESKWKKHHFLSLHLH